MVWLKDKISWIKQRDFLLSFSSLLFGIVTVLIYYIIQSEYCLPRLANVIFNIVSFIFTVLGALGILYSAVKYLNSLNLIGQKIANFQDIVEKQQNELKLLQACHTICTTKTNSIAIWNKYNNPKTIELNLSNMDDYIIQVPVYLAMNTFKSEKLFIHKNNCYTDENAINNVVKNGGIALADPYYVQSGGLLNKQDLVILSPLLIKNPLKHLQKNETEKSLIFVYDNSPESTAGRLEELSDEETRKKLKPLKEVVKELIHIMSQSTFWEKVSGMEDNPRRKCKIDIELFNEKIKEHNIEQINEWYEMFIYILGFYGKHAKLNEKEKLKTEFEKFSDFYLMEPELSFIEKIILENETKKSYTVSPLIDNETNVIFTTIITTRNYLGENPITILKFLKSIRIGILRCHSLIGNNSKMKLLEELKKSQLEDRYKESIKIILDYLEGKAIEITSDLYPEDLIIYNSELPETDIAFQRLKKINTDPEYIYKYILSQNDLKRNDEIKFIMEGLQL